MKKNLLTLAVLTVLSYSYGAEAQVPPSADPSRLQGSFSGERPVAQTTTAPLIRDEREQNVPPAEAEKIHFVLKSLNVTGNTIFSDADLQSIYSGEIGNNISLSDLYVIRDAITKKYRENGYIISRAIIPAQKFEKNGANAKVQVIEGFINSVSVTGKTKGNMNIVNNYIEKIKKSGPLNSNNLERYLLLMNDLAGTQATATLRPAANGLGGSDVIINLDHRLVDGLISVDNSGSKYIGPILATGQVDLNSALGMSEKITLRGIADTNVENNDLKNLNIIYKQPIGYEGTYARFEAGQTLTHPGATLENLNIRGDSKIYDAEIVHPFVRSRKENFSARAGITLKDTETNSLGLNVYDDRLTIATLGGTYDYADTHGGVNLVDFSVSQGFDGLGSSDKVNRSRANGDDVFTRYNFEASRNQKITNRLTLLVAAAGQYANQGLLASEEFGVGGREYGRGYDFSEITGDSGIAGKVELQYGIDFSVKYLTNIQLYTFYDLGRVWQEEAYVSGEMSQDSLASTGAGLRFNITKSITGYTEIAKPLTKKIQAENDRELQFNFGIGYLF